VCGTPRQAVDGDETVVADLVTTACSGDRRAVARLLTLVEGGGEPADAVAEATHPLAAGAQVVGIMTVTSNPYPNPKEDNERFIVVDVKFKKRLKKPVTLKQMKKEKSFKDWELLRIGRLSVMPVPKNIWDKIIKMSQ